MAVCSAVYLGGDGIGDTTLRLHLEDLARLSCQTEAILRIIETSTTLLCTASSNRRNAKPMDCPSDAGGHAASRDKAHGRPLVVKVFHQSTQVRTLITSRCSCMHIEFLYSREDLMDSRMDHVVRWNIFMIEEAFHRSVRYNTRYK